MLLLTRTVGTVRICESWFASERIVGSYDVVFYRQSAVPMSEDAQEYTTFILSLAIPEADLFARFRKNFRYEIKKAETSDDLSCCFVDVHDALEMMQLYEFYDAFADSKGLAPLNRVEIERIKEAASLYVTCVRYDGDTLVYHIYIGDGKRARLLRSASRFREADSSDFRNLIGRSNRYLHWWDIQSFKNRGYQQYDLGGCYMGSDDLSKKNVKDFKAGFGGDTVVEYHSSQALTLKGRLALLWLKYRFQ